MTKSSLTTDYASDNKKAREHIRERIQDHYGLSRKQAAKVINIAMQRTKRNTLERLYSINQGKDVKHYILLSTHEYPDVFLTVIQQSDGYRKIVTALNPDYMVNGISLKKLAYRRRTQHMSLFEKLKYSIKTWSK